VKAISDYRLQTRQPGSPPECPIGVSPGVTWAYRRCCWVCCWP